MVQSALDGASGVLGRDAHGVVDDFGEGFEDGGAGGDNGGAGDGGVPVAFVL